MSPLRQALDDMAALGEYLGEREPRPTEWLMCWLEMDGWNIVITTAPGGFCFDASHQDYAQIRRVDTTIAAAANAAYGPCLSAKRDYEAQQAKERA